MTVEATPESPSPIGGARRFSRPSVLSIIGLVFVGLIALVLLRNFIADPQEFINITLIGITTGCVYAIVVVFGWPVLAMVALGLAEAIFGFRQRYLKGRPPPLPAS